MRRPALRHGCETLVRVTHDFDTRDARYAGSVDRTRACTKARGRGDEALAHGRSQAHWKAYALPISQVKVIDREREGEARCNDAVLRNACEVIGVGIRAHDGHGRGTSRRERVHTGNARVEILDR